MKAWTSWHLSLDDEFREYINIIVVIAVIFALGILSLGFYNSYVFKAKMVEVYFDLRSYQVFVHEYYALNQRLPSDELLQTEFVDSPSDFNNPNYGLYSARIEYADITFDQGELILQFSDSSPELGGFKLHVYPIVDERASLIHWVCGNAQMPGILHEKEPETTLPEKFLVKICRE